MEFMLDTIHLEDIERLNDIIPLAGVTSNPSIIKKEGKIDLFAQLKKIKNIIKDAPLHVQVVASSCADILKESEIITQKLGKDTYIKVPTNVEGLKAMKLLKQQGYNVTATAIYSEFQAYLAVNTGADYIAPYYNRMENMNIDAADVIGAVVQYIHENNANTKVLGASYKNIAQVNQSIRMGIQSVTLSADIYEQALGNVAIAKAVTDFSQDWKDTFGCNNLLELEG